MKTVNILVPSDKSVSHRAVMFSSVSKGVTRIKNLLMSEDIKRTIEAFQAMGVKISLRGNNAIVRGVGMCGLKKPGKPVYLGNSGTTMRLLPGILAGQDFEVVLTGDRSLSSRPMKRIAEPLIKMGTLIKGKESGVKGEMLPPLKISGGKLKAIRYKSKIASAQVKSCILLAGLYAEGITSVSEPEKSRDHTERMLEKFGCRVLVSGRRVSVNGPVELKTPGLIEVPGDISSAAFFIVAGCILPDIKIVLKNVGLNPTRSGIISILKKMGADIEVKVKEMETDRLEPAGDIIVKSSRLKGAMVSSKEVVLAIDEMPVIMAAACFAKGKTVIKGIGELRVKETDRVHSMITNLRKLGADIAAQGEAIIINGGKPLYGAKVSSFGDHRTAMSMLVAGLGAKGKVTVTGLDCINKSFPSFMRLFKKLN